MPVPGSLELPRRTAVQFEQSGPGALILDRTMKSRPGSTVAFFVDDYRLEPLWNWPRRTVRRLSSLRPAALIEPDFSQYEDMPTAMALWNLYRSRWVARFWQESGFIVIPSLSWNSATIEQLHLGIPAGSPVACECRPRFKNAEILQTGLRLAIERIQPRSVLLYGAEAGFVASLPAGPRYVTLPAWSPKKRMSQP